MIVVGQMTEKFYKRKGQKLNPWDTRVLSQANSNSLARTDMVEEAVYLAITECNVIWEVCRREVAVEPHGGVAGVEERGQTGLCRYFQGQPKL